MLHLPVLALIVFFVFICNFYIESISLNHLESFRTFRVGSIASFGLSILVGFFWEHADNVEFKHSISTGVVIAMLFFMLGKIYGKAKCRTFLGLMLQLLDLQQ